MNIIQTLSSSKEKDYIQITKELIYQERGLHHSLDRYLPRDTEASRQWVRQLPMEQKVTLLSRMLL